MNRASLISVFLVSVIFTSLAPQEGQRTIFLKADERSPVKIRQFKVRGREVATDKPFFETDDWLKGLTVELTNSSDKTVTYVMVQVFFPRPQRAMKKPGAAIFMEYGDSPFRYKSADEMPPLRVKPIAPGDSLEITLSDTQYGTISPLLATAGIPDNNNVEIRVASIGFNDGTAWTGQMAQRNPNGGWMPIRSQD